VTKIVTLCSAARISGVTGYQISGVESIKPNISGVNMTGKDVKKLRATLNCSQQALADGLGISVRTVQGWEGQNKLSQGYAMLLEHLLTCRELRKKVQRRMVKLQSYRSRRTKQTEQSET